MKDEKEFTEGYEVVCLKLKGGGPGKKDKEGGWQKGTDISVNTEKGFTEGYEVVCLLAYPPPHGGGAGRRF